MIAKLFRVLLAVLITARIGCDWVKLPQITNTPKVTYKLQTVSSFSDFPSSSVLSNSDLMSSVFSYDSKKSTTTERPLVTQSSVIKQSNSKKYLISTVTSKTVEFEKNASDRIDNDELEMEPVKLMPVKSESKKVIYFNQTIPMKVLPSVVDEGEKETSKQDEDDDDGVTVLDEDDELSSSEEAASEEEYYEEDEELPTVSSTTTKAPRKVSRKPLPMKPQRRIIPAQAKPRIQNPLSFGHFLKFLKNIQQSFTTRTAKNITDKIKMLREFRDNLLLTINQRIKSLWKTKAKKQHRTKRTLGGGGGGWMEGGGGMDFPSAEAALLSISFLTFAVFLIKLVLQVIQTIKMKKYGYASQMSPDIMQQSSVVLKKYQRAARDVTFQHPDDLIFTQHFLANSLSFQPVMNQGFERIL